GGIVNVASAAGFAAAPGMAVYNTSKAAVLSLTETMYAELAGSGVAAVAEIDSSAKIPVGGTVAVGRLSAAGEQYLDFRPDSDTGPYLTDGALVERSQTTVPVTVQSV
ncbi:SDR family NAD(P)-dependent oxidoreductase, partial [Nocardia nova]|uniref:SDR family NAD(P)-dependent oxidoreductase n=1 Tax=Nocardia nova TaxID=37330 RepID=UPI001E31F93A